jgi:hypothetical protein
MCDLSVNLVFQPAEIYGTVFLILHSCENQLTLSRQILPSNRLCTQLQFNVSVQILVCCFTNPITIVHTCTSLLYSEPVLLACQQVPICEHYVTIHQLSSIESRKQ